MTRRSYCTLMTSGAMPMAFAGQMAAAAVTPAGYVVNVTDFGAKGDGRTDDTAAIQKAMDSAARTGGMVVLPPARYLVGGSLRIPPGVALEGVLDSPQWAEPLAGSLIFATNGRD